MVARFCVALSMAMTAAAKADVVSILGDQDFADGAFALSTDFDVASVGEPSPFDEFRGNDNAIGPNFTAAWTHTFLSGAVPAATITIGLCDHDSRAPGSQLAVFSVDGLDLTSLLNGAMEAHGGSQAECNVYTLDLPGPALALLLDGQATFVLTLKGPGLGGIPGHTDESLPMNGAGLDFSELEIVPAPSSLALLGLAGMTAARRRR